MTEKNIIKGNKLIAAFEGANIHKNEAYKNNEYATFPEDTFDGMTLIVTKLKYHEDWNWLMPVCKKILVLYHDNRQGMFSGLHNCDIEETFNGVVEFINFWNDPKQKKLTWKS